MYPVWHRLADCTIGAFFAMICIVCQITFQVIVNA